ncbi:MAG: DNA-binding protein [Thermodesulfobacteriota bacterium]
MKKWSIFSIAALLVLLAPGVSGAQSLVKAREKPVRYDPATVETVSGIVVAAPRPTPPGGISERAQLTLKTDKETITVFLGPGWFVDQQGLKIANLDRVQVTGSRILVQGKPALIAGEIRKGDRILKLRDDRGQPLWRGGSRR